jgi:hypothetical protein
VTAKLGTFGFVEGKEWDRSKAMKQLPQGTYRVRIEVKFLQRPPADNDPVPIWPGDAIMSRTAELEIYEPPAAKQP